jgi:hypothetical protein
VPNEEGAAIMAVRSELRLRATRLAKEVEDAQARVTATIDSAKHCVENSIDAVARRRALVDRVEPLGGLIGHGLNSE